jgi:UDP-GlcNAc:undecaprenyl-phosphate GlcNAc-1-phosphate transferase
MALRLVARFQSRAVRSAALAGAALGFLRYNYPPAKIFMGTVGAQFLGFALAGISVAGAFKIATLVAIAAPILILGVPLFDTTFVVLRRAVNGRRIDEADTTHLHHRLLNRGLSHRQVIWVIYLLTFALCAVAYALFCRVK